MNIHLITYLTSKLFWIYTVFRYNTILYPKNEDTQKLFAYFCAYLLSCWGSMQWGTMYGDLIFELIALLIITVAYQADWQHHVWNTLMVYIMGILCDGIPIVFFQRYAVARNPVHHHMGPGTIVMGNFIFFLLEVIIERKVGVKRSYYIKNRHWLAMLSVPVISIISGYCCQTEEVCGLRLYYSYCLSMCLFSICTMRFRKVILKQQNRKR